MCGTLYWQTFILVTGQLGPVRTFWRVLRVEFESLDCY